MRVPITINPIVIEENNSSVAECLALLYYYFNKELDTGINPLIEKGFISRRYENNLPMPYGYFLTDKGIAFMEHILLESEKDTLGKEIDFERLAKSLKEIYPKGKKYNTRFYWVDNIPAVIKKLKIFFKRYGEFSEENIIKATERYVQSFNGDYTYMQLLKYFIWKNKADGSEDSELLNYLENIDEKEEINNGDWTTNLV